jgi:hypothetical protein
MTIINQLTSFKLSGITYTGTSQQLNYTAGVTTGSVVSNKALVVDSNRDLIGTDNTTRVRNLTLAGALTAVNINGVLQTTNQPNITSVGSLNNLTVVNNVTINNHNGIDTGLILGSTLVTANAHQINYNTVTPGTASGNKSLVLDSSRAIGNIHTLTSQHIYTDNFYLDDVLITASADNINFLDIISPGQGQASKAMVLDSNRNINNINSLTTNTLNVISLNVTNLSGTIITTHQPNIISVGTLIGLTMAGAITGVTNLSSNSLTLNGTLITATGNEINSLSGLESTSTELNYLNGITLGSASANKVLTADASRNLSNLNRLFINGIEDVITINNSNANARTNLRFINDSRSWEVGSRGSTASNPNTFYFYDNTAGQMRLILNASGSFNILAHNGSTSGLQLAGTLVTATAAELNILDGVTATTTELNYLDITSIGIAQASKAMILDSSRNINNINILGSVQFNTNSTSTTSINNSTVTGNYDIYLRRQDITTGLSHGIAFATTTNDPSTTVPGASILFTRVTSITGHLSFNTAQLERLRILDNGNIGIGTTNPGKRLEINSSSGDCLRLTYNDSDGSATLFTDLSISASGQLTISPSSNNATSVNGDILLKGSVIIGKDSSNNLLRFNGTTGDSNANFTVIAERIYGGTEQSELLLFKGNDPSGSAGPDRIRLRAAEHIFQTYTSAEDFSAYGDNNTRLFIGNNGNIGIGISGANAKLEMYQSTGSPFLRLTNSVTAGFVDLNTYADGSLQIKSSNNYVHIGDSTNTSQTLVIGTLSTTGTSGTIRILSSGGVNYIQSGFNALQNSAADLFIGNMTNPVLNSSRKIIFKGDGKVGFGTSSPERALEINDTTGNCLRLTFNDSDGSASTYCDVSINTNGLVTFNAVGTSSGFAFNNGNISGTLNTSDQPNITSLGTLTGLTMSGAISGVTNFTMSGTLSGASSISATNISGLLTTANQSNITSLGRLNNLSIANNLKLGDNTTAEDYIHIEQNTNAFIGIQIENRNSNAETSGCKLSFMGYRDSNLAYEVCRIASVTTASDAPALYQYGALAFYTRNGYLDANLTERMRIINNGNIGINISNPTERLHVSGNILATGNFTNSGNISSSGSISTTSGITSNNSRMTINGSDLGISHVSFSGTTKSELVTYSNGSITGIGSYNAFPMCLMVQDTERLRITTSGNVGIGTTNPQGFLDLGTRASNNSIILYQDGTNVYSFGANDNALKYSSAGSSGHIWYTGSTLSSTGTERMRLQNNGFLGIGTSSPTTTLMVRRTTNDNSFIRWTDGTTIAETWINASGVPSMGTNTNHGFGFYTNNGSSTQLFLDPGSSKNVGIGTNTPSFKLDVNGTTKVTQLLVGDSTDNASNRIISALNSTITTGNTRNFICIGKANSSNNQGEISFNWVSDGSGTNYLSLGMHSSSNTLNITGNGFVGIGVTNPSYKLDVSGNLRLGSNLIVSSDIYAGTYVYTASTSTAGRYVGDWTGTGYWGIGPNGSNELRIGTCSSSSGTWTGYANFVAGRLLMPVDGYGLSHRNGPSGTTELITTVGSSYTAIGSYSNTNLEFYVNNAWKFMLNTSDQMIRPVGFSTTISATSDIRLKENIITADLDLCYDKIKNLRLVHYKWKDFVIEKNKTDENNFDKSKLGWIAQEVQSIIPRAININKNNEFNIDNCLSIDTEHIYINLYGCTKKLIEDKENLELENQKLNNKIDEMEEVITDLYEQVDNLNNTVEELKKIVNGLLNK